MGLMDFTRPRRFTTRLTPLIPPALALSILLRSAATLYGGEEGWDEQHSRWLLALTYPASEENPDDFGKETAEADRILLERFKPRVIVSPKGLLPVDFYNFYLPRTVVRDESRKGVVVREAPSRECLKRIERERARNRSPSSSSSTPSPSPSAVSRHVWALCGRASCG